MVECFERLDELERLYPEWEELCAAHRPWLPFFGPTWNRLWWRHFAESNRLVKDHLRLCSVRSSDGQLVAVAPLMLTERPAHGPLRARMLQFLGADPLVTEARGMLCAVERDAAAYDALLSHIDETRDQWDFVRWSAIPADVRVHAVFRSNTRVSPVPSASAFVLDLPSSWEELRARLPRNIKESLRKCYNSLRRDGLTFEFRVLAGRDALEGVERFFALHRLRAEREGTTGHNDVFASPRARAFLRDYFRESPPGASLVFQLLIGGEPVATRVGFRSDRSLYLYYSGYEPSFSRYSVMTTLLAETLKWAIGEGVTLANLSFGQDVSKSRWRPREIAFHEARWAAPSMRAQVLERAFHGLDRLRKHRRFTGVARQVLSQLTMRGAGAGGQT